MDNTAGFLFGFGLDGRPPLQVPMTDLLKLTNTSLTCTAHHASSHEIRIPNTSGWSCPTVTTTKPPQPTHSCVSVHVLSMLQLKPISSLEQREADEDVPRLAILKSILAVTPTLV